MKRGVAPVLILAFLGLGGAEAQRALTPAPHASPSIAIVRPLAHPPAPLHVAPPIVHAAPLARPVVVPRTGSIARPIAAPLPGVRQPAPASAAEPGVNAPSVSVPLNAPAPTPTPNPLHFRRMALPTIIAFA